MVIKKINRLIGNNVHNGLRAFMDTDILYEDSIIGRELELV